MKEGTIGGLIAIIIIGIILGVLGFLGGVGGFKDKPILDAHIFISTASLDMRVKGGGLIWIDLNGDIKVKVDQSVPGTLLTVNDLFWYKTPATAKDVIITVRTEKQKKAWEKSIERAREKLKRSREPKDIPPPRI